jgi:hypothetical protein
VRPTAPATDEGVASDGISGATLLKACAAAVVLASCFVGLAQPAQAQGPIDLLTEANVRIDGATAGDQTAEVAGAGDVNGDGRSDVIVGGVFANAAYVVFGRDSMGTVDLSDLGSAGFRIAGAAPGNGVGDSVDGAGDVNGDGLADVVVGAPFAINDRGFLGAVYVVFGKASSEPVDLGALGARGFRIDGADGDGVGTAVGGGGDVNGDGRSDVIVGGIFSDFNGRENSGSAYVVFGKASSDVVDLAALGTGGFRMDGPDAFDEIGFSVADAGDVNADGRSDVVVGAPSSDQDGFFAGSAWVMFGKGSSAPVDLAALGTSGFRISAAAVLDFTGWSVAGAGDVNGDGRADVIVGAPFAPNNAEIGAAFVVFGKASSTEVPLAALADGGFRLDGAEFGDRAGDSVGGAGDVDGDGRADVVVGAPGADNNGRTDSGSAYVVFGKASTGAVPLEPIETGGFRIDGAAQDDRLGDGGGIFDGGGVDGAGDFLGDGLPDLVLGAPFADNNGRTDSGSAYLVSVTGAEQQLAELIELVRSFDLPKGTETSLISKLEAALRAVRSDREGDACGALQAFVNFTRAQAGKTLTGAQAERLLADASRIGLLLSCPAGS